MKSLLLFLLVLVLAGCHHTKIAKNRQPGRTNKGQINLVELGMTREQVLHILGRPVGMDIHQGVETFHYIEDSAMYRETRLQVTLVDGKVTEFGEAPRVSRPVDANVNKP